MFLADARVTVATLVLVAIGAGLRALGMEPIVCGGVLLFGCLATLVEAVHRYARGSDHPWTTGRNTTL
ncbi:MAG TPA: hypothetical protein VLX85_09155 [Stellaceae bacterium]|nr:hypothetical protein [Stellaceae bacterium]